MEQLALLINISWDTLTYRLKLDFKARELKKDVLLFIRRFEMADEAPLADFQALALRIFSYQFQNNKFYRKFCLVEEKTPKNTLTWKDIPAMPADGFKEFDLRSFLAMDTERIFRTSGTTGAQRGQHFFETLELYQASLLPSFKKYLLPDQKSMPMFFLTASPNALQDSSLSYMMGVLNKCLGYDRKDAFYVKKDKILFEKLVADLLKEKKPVMVLATAFSLMSFLDYLKRNKIKLALKPGSRLMETGGFKGRANEVTKKVLYAESKKWLGIPPQFCVSEYGMTELSSQYYDTTLRDTLFSVRQKPFKAPPAWMRTLVVDPRTGEEAAMGAKGILRHFDLSNLGSVLAVETQDLGKRRKIGFEFIGRASRADIRGCSLTYEEFLKNKK